MPDTNMQPFFDRDAERLALVRQGENKCRGANGWFYPRTIRQMTMNDARAIVVDIFSSRPARSANITLRLRPRNAFAFLQQMANVVMLVDPTILVEELSEEQRHALQPLLDLPLPQQEDE